MDPLTQIFEERLQEIEAYLDLLGALERQVREGPPKIGGDPITSQQQKILYSSVYLQLYNLVEATVTWCVDAVVAATEKGGWRPDELIEKLRREWVRSTARTHLELNQENRLEAAVKLCDHFVQALPLLKWSVDGGRRGNWADDEIENITARLGCNLRISTEVYSGIKRPIREDKGSLVLVRYLRNKLAHGALSFTECGDNVTVDDLIDLKQRTALYLREVVAAFRSYIDGYEFLVPASRP